MNKSQLLITDKDKGNWSLFYLHLQLNKSLIWSIDVFHIAINTIST